MNIVNLIENYVELKKVTANEYAGPCVFCPGGHDRFIVFEKNQRYWCRKCDAKGDAYQFLKDHLKLTHSDIQARLGRMDFTETNPLKPIKVKPEKIEQTPTWSDQAQRLTAYCHQKLLENEPLIEWLNKARGLNLETIKHWRLGFNPTIKFHEPELWGFKSNEKKIFAPQGITIPHLRPDGRITGINIRRFKATDSPPIRFKPLDEGERPYIRIRGTVSEIWRLSDGLPNIIVESELDALLLWQELKLVASPIAILSASARPENYSPDGPVLFALDFDEAGKEPFKWWEKKYNAHSCPPIRGKDISEMYLAGVSLMKWFGSNLKLIELK